MNELYSDCFMIGTNPSKKGGGYVVTDNKGNIIDKETIYRPGFTNNEGELLGVLRATELIDSHGTVYTDSQNTIKWINRGYSKARPDLGHIMARAKKNIKIKNIKLTWVRREVNKAGITVEKTHNLY